MPGQQITQILTKLRSGDSGAAAELLPLVYDELRALARRYLGQERPGHTLQATALVHEAYVRLVGGEPVEWQDRAHFFGVAAQAMRRILVDHARARDAAKRGGERRRVPLESLADTPEHRDEYLLALDHALQELADVDAHLARVVELRFFGGLTVEETAAVCRVSAATIKRDWVVAKGWLHRAIVAGE